MALLDLPTNPRVQARVDELAEKCNEGRLTPAERSEYDALIWADHFLGILLVARDARREAIRALAVRDDETLRCRRLAQSERLDEIQIPVRSRRTSDRAYLGFENHGKTHLLTLHSNRSTFRLGSRARCVYPTLVG